MIDRTLGIQPYCVICGTKDHLGTLSDIPQLLAQSFPGQTVKLCTRHLRWYTYIPHIQALTPHPRIRDKRRFQKSENKLFETVSKLFADEELYRNIRPLWALSGHGHLMEYDICLPRLRLLIEYDGRQHSEFSRFFHKDERKFHSQVARDAKKEQLAQYWQWRLVHFTYKDKLNEDIVKERLKAALNSE